MGEIFAGDKFLGITLKEAWSIFHGTVLGGGFLLLFPVVIAGLFLLGSKSISEKMNGTYIRFLVSMALIVTALAWLTDIIGTYLPYPGYRVKPPDDVTNLLKYPRSYLLSVPYLAVWEKGMHWKEYLGWVVPILCTPASYILSVYGKSLEDVPKLRKAVLIVFLIAFITAGIAGILGMLVTKLAPVR